jgi:hypothetical protein
MAQVALALRSCSGKIRFAELKPAFAELQPGEYPCVTAETQRVTHAISGRRTRHDCPAETEGRWPPERPGGL